MQSSSFYVSFALNTLNCSQKTLATMLSVSPTQITKWKKDEHMSESMRNQILSLVGVDANEVDPELVAYAGSLEEANRWVSYFEQMAENSRENAEHSYSCDVFTDDQYLCYSLPMHFINLLQSIGFEVPKTLPNYFTAEYPDEELDDGESDATFDNYENTMSHPLTSLITCTFDALVDIAPVYSMYILPIGDELIENHIEEGSIVFDIYHSLIELALLRGIENKINDYKDLYRTTAFFNFKSEILSWFNKSLYNLKKLAYKENIPMEYDIAALANESSGELGMHVEAKSFGFGEHKIHPDVFMDEIIKSQRVLHFILPKILEKLDIEVTAEDIVKAQKESLF